MLGFTVLLSVYKKEKPFFLEQALQSISDKQSVKPNEIIIIRDGLLTDSLDIILDNFLTKYPNIVTNERKNNSSQKYTSYEIRTEPKVGKRLFQQMYNDLPAIKRTESIKIDDLEKNNEIYKHKR